MKKLKIIIPLFLVALLIFMPSFTVANALISDDAELNWYFVNRNDGKTPECPKESADFFEDLDAYYVGDTNKKVLYLTFDEGYENGNTPKILDILKEEKVPAAFFVVKPYIKDCPDIVKRMEEEGHLVCNHTSHHPSMAKITDAEKFKKEFTDVEDEFKELTGKDMPKFFRPPMGKYSKNSLKKTKDLGYKTIFWSFAYKDWLVDNQPSEDAAIKKITSGAHNGSIMLLHAVSDTNVKVLKTVIEQLKSEGYEFKPLTELPEH
ncbi:delta-lactam-biosynthetic de-N-acetylase [Clostridium septicum]|uniref:Delta-lactam-biosynthetic de-N-acetylase n=2 Tax=Clostridium septicum TaxID=1504 RepID=A0A9N7JPP6_CLOSE|nr:delta-lactam-biosynthetic de-N-acetylase [Clostridium septicum]QAS60989.1 delta-lactam-biosynthetic de-N-acetylase [Clostridium septicum]